MPFLLPIAVLGGTGIFAWKAGEEVGSQTSTLVKIGAVGAGLYLLYKLQKG
ncbi:hypothetical protein NVP1080O_12 [Vibrio phage 1.080.O._10N.286.48.A4]|uniref:Uncharacterized protein n=2 Tax=Autolykiviridae TaxID=2184034 RepID=A0A2I7QWF0_9VIRU|nr:hypothetical protein KMD67_gp12 [Vibrio phage 1.080.O._10N.286.48.A4]AUR85728.1 hypothetical protein NVP1080O_12 [Vibrio phage 1.080.O._10N.286.48.A4]AUR90315.1 hypothetical protein NVP1141A_12 [Vibrio phage 1.141.A._10N.261.49.B3]